MPYIKNQFELSNNTILCGSIVSLIKQGGGCNNCASLIPLFDKGLSKSSKWGLTQLDFACLKKIIFFKVIQNLLF